MEKQLKILIAELQSYEKSLNFNMAGYTQMLPDGKEHFCCKMCGHSPALLIERLKLLLPEVETPEERNTNIKFNKDGTISPIDPSKPTRLSTEKPETREERHSRLSDHWSEL